MYLEYIDENLKKIMENQDNILYIRTEEVDNKRALFATIKEDEGVYRKFQITKAQSRMQFPWEPLYWFHEGPGYLLLNNFIILNNNNLALNKDHLEGFKSKELDNNKIFNTGVFATFDDGSATFVRREKAKKFEKQGGIQKYIDLLKQYKEYNPKYDTYEIIEAYKVSNSPNNNIFTFIIPELQAKTEEKPKTKKLTNN